MQTQARPMMTNGSGTHGHKSVKKTSSKKKEAKTPPKKPKDSKPK